MYMVYIPYLYVSFSDLEWAEKPLDRDWDTQEAGLPHAPLCSAALAALGSNVTARKLKWPLNAVPQGGLTSVLKGKV